uniref:NADH-quinone oxidoreductase subunit M n=1 Tax=Thermosporothrix sp. COM3 TaxID=2490863 RepID=A0A455SN68_9CHLR|nr:NADH-quinone oxidoreductase subunit M [Thermosporothrix sp. COM3]
MDILFHPLTLIILLPVIGALVAYLTPTKVSRWVALIFSALVFVVTLYLLGQGFSHGFGSLKTIGAVNRVDWNAVRVDWISIPIGKIPFNVQYFMGVDGLGLPLVVLNGMLTVLAIIGGWRRNRVKDYFALLLLLEAGVMGVFTAMDLFLFFLFWEVELAPMFLLIGIWGNEQIKHGVPGRIYSAWKFLLYTFFGSVFMLVGFLLLYFMNAGTAGATITASMPYFADPAHMPSGTLNILGITASAQLVLFLLIFVAFAVKIPMFPFHTWLPDAHTDAPTEVSVILAGVLLKMGAYGLIRICFTLFPEGIHAFAPWMAGLAVINIIYGAAICLVQKDMKKLIAYSSISHMGITLLGVAAAAGSGNVQFREVALMGATFQLISHGLISGMLFFCVGVIYDHAHTRMIADFGGVAKKMPRLATLFTLAGMASLGLPALAGFVAEYMVFTSSYKIWPVATVVSVFTMILTAGYLLWMLKRVFFGPFNKKWSWLPDANPREMVPLVILAAFIVIVGIYPKFLIDVLLPSLHHVLYDAAQALIK